MENIQYRMLTGMVSAGIIIISSISIEKVRCQATSDTNNNNKKRN